MGYMQITTGWKIILMYRSLLTTSAFGCQNWTINHVGNMSIQKRMFRYGSILSQEMSGVLTLILI
ncbi:hypothetical protein HMPREF1250_0139 [Megasphaera vaginalis (ex Srinivasan et al. 2021)]|uniref:Uncharacterized protein n=1 Tax=Megasphaera vaginalis (ex Srinivasan et al. 2021) TaxID=1111454 RepID=U7UW85_9FIRM|nr:hypothetical protein HMPREF1250_0139 [Megasphaera vaginalis (ex Srinivasan et al. 2021)]